MSEKKKRVRPTVAQVKELEAQLGNEQNLHIYFAKENDKLKSKIADIEQKEKLLEAELKVVRRDLKKEIEISMGRLVEIEKLKSRGILGRIFNW